jgi:hypothetical protein
MVNELLNALQNRFEKESVCFQWLVVVRNFAHKVTGYPPENAMV